MAYANLLSLSLSNPTETFQRFRDFMCSRGIYAATGVGWTYHDSSYAISETSISINDYFVMYSAGEDGSRDLYFKVSYVSGYIAILGYLYWNNSTHAGVYSYGLANHWANTLATNNILWIYADLDSFLGISKYGTTYNSGRGGWMPDSTIDQTVTVCPNSISSGSSVTVTFTSVPSSWIIGTQLFVRDNANIEKVVVSNISGSNVTFTSFVSSYSSGSKLLFHQVFC